MSTVKALGVPKIKGISLARMHEENDKMQSNFIRIPYKLLAETETKPGLGLDGRIAEDMKDVSYLKEIKDNQKKYWEKHKNIFNKKDIELFEMMKDLFTDVSMFDLEKIGLDMCEKFHNGAKGNYTDKKLNRNVFGSNEFGEYHKKNLESIRNVIFKNTADFKFLKDKTLFIPRMSFDGLKNNAMGLGITIHQVYATKIELIDYFCDLDKKYWQGIFRYTLFDHFGLDWNDVLLHGEDSMPSPNTGNHFKAWYLLQRYRKAKPFIVELKHEMYVNGKF